MLLRSGVHIRLDCFVLVVVSSDGAKCFIFLHTEQNDVLNINTYINYFY